MKLKYGNYTHDLNEAVVSIRREVIEDSSRAGLGNKTTWTISGRLHGDDPTDLDKKIALLEEAYGVNGKDLVLLHNDGTETAHYLKNYGSIGGVRIKNLSWPKGDGAEYVTFRTYQIEAFAEYLFSAGAVETSWQETVTVIGTGGPRFVVREVRNGPPVRQQVSDATPVRATQSGSATGYGAYPLPPPPLWPQWEVEAARSVTNQQNKKSLVYQTNWAYQFESPTPL